MQGLITRQLREASLVPSMPGPVVTASLAYHFSRSGDSRGNLSIGQLCLEGFLASAGADLNPMPTLVALDPLSPLKTSSPELADEHPQVHCASFGSKLVSASTSLSLGSISSP
mgnify:CR=1 FL=1